MHWRYKVGSCVIVFGLAVVSLILAGRWSQSTPSQLTDEVTEVDPTFPPPSPTATPTPGEPTGYIHLSPDKSGFVYDGRARFVPYGINATTAWWMTSKAPRADLKDPSGDRFWTYEEWMAALVAAGVNSVRIALGAGAAKSYLGMEVPPLGSYYIADAPLTMDGTYQQQQVNGSEPDFAQRRMASNLTHLIEAAEHHGVKLCIVFWDAGDLYKPWRWAQNPYNFDCHYPDGSLCIDADRGVITEPQMFFTDPTAFTYQTQFVDFVIETWGESEAIWSWEVMNEVHLAAEWEPTAVQAMVEWVDKMSRYIAKRDPHRRPVTVSSVSLLSNGQIPDREVSFSDSLAVRVVAMKNAMFDLPHIDFVSFHNYVEFTLAGRLALTRRMQALWDKPIVVNEFWPARIGHQPVPASAATDPLVTTGLLEIPWHEEPPFYNSLGYIWLQLMITAGGGGAMRWPGFGEVQDPKACAKDLDNAHACYEEILYTRPELYELYTPVATFSKEVDWYRLTETEAWEERVPVKGDASFKAAQGNQEAGLLMLVGRGTVTVTIDGLRSGDYTIKIFDWRTGQVTGFAVHQSTNGDSLSFELDLSTFDRGVGIVYIRLYRK